MNTTDAVKKISLTLNADVYELLEEICRRETRHRSRQISWIIKQYAANRTPAPDITTGASDVIRNGNIVYFPARGNA
jgi:metal-responsive CopG/Arc/MetJ family transcriptional regulator